MITSMFMCSESQSFSLIGLLLLLPVTAVWNVIWADIFQKYNERVIEQLKLNMFIGFIKIVTTNYQLLSLICTVSIYVLPIPNFIFQNAKNQIISLSYSLLINRTFHSSISKLFFTVLCELTWYVLHLHDKVVLKMLTFMFMICIFN